MLETRKLELKINVISLSFHGQLYTALELDVQDSPKFDECSLRYGMRM